LSALLKAAIRATKTDSYDAVLMRIMIDYLQTLMIIKNYDLNWPSVLESALDTFTMISQAANEKIFSLDCFIKSRNKLL